MGTFTLNILSFPLWWYTVGAGLTWKRYKRQIHFAVTKSGILLFARHMREPLYGDYTRSGVILGFFLRTILLVFKTFILGGRVIITSIVLLAYFIALPCVVIMIVYQFFPS